MNKKPFLYVLGLLSTFLGLLIGKISWSCPPWLERIRQKAATRPYHTLACFTGLLGALIAAHYIHHWYQHRPKPHLVIAQITQPPIAAPEEAAVPTLLTLDFGTQNNGFIPASVAPLANIGKTVAEGIAMTPAMAGKWEWQSDSRLVFTPATPWPAGQTYSIHFNKNVFAATAKMATLDYSFSTLPFQANIKEFKFYQDPVNPQLRQAIATVEFNYPVDSKSFESNTTLMLQALKDAKLDLTAQRFKITFTYDTPKRTAYLHSESLPIPKESRYLRLTIDKGVKPVDGPSITDAILAKHILIPDAASYFKVNSTNISIVRNEQDRPEQILTVETTLGVTDAELSKTLHAYLLPQDYPATGIEPVKTHYNWQNPGEVSDSILKLSASVPLQPMPTERDFATLHSYKINVPAGRYVYLRLEKGTRSFGDFTLANAYATVMKAPDYPKEIGFLHSGALLALSGEKKLSILVRGVPAVKFQFARVLPDNINQLITQTEGNFNNPRFINQSFTQNNISEIFSEVQRFNADPAQEQYTALDIGKYLAARKGLFLLQATGWDAEKNTALDVKNNRLILITDMGLITKDNRDGTHDLFVQSITRGTPVAGATAAILGKNGLPVLTRTTDAQGHASFPSLKDFVDEHEPTVYVVTAGNDVSFIPYGNADRQLNYSRFDVGGLYDDVEGQTLRAYIFSDRGIYRPGDTAHIAMIIKQAYIQPQPAGLPMELIISDAKGTTVRDQKLVLDPTGYLTVDFPTSATAPTGQYAINLFIVKDNHADNLLGSTTIHVNDFQPDRLRINAHLSKEQEKGWITPNDLSASINLWNLYGAPATDRKVTAKITLAPQRVQFAEYPQYTFVDPLFDPKKPQKIFTDELTDARTDSKGVAQFSLNLERFDKATYQLTFAADGFEADGGRSVAAQTRALVSPLAYFIGYKPDGDLSYIKQNSQRSVNFIAVNPQLKQQAVNQLRIQLSALHPVSTLVKNADGTFQYQSIVQTSVINTQPFAVSAQGTQYVLPTQTIGDFLVTVLDQNNTELSKFKFSVVGTSTATLPKNAELSVKLNKAEYLPDEEIELQITAPYTGAGLITIERDKVYAMQWFNTNTTNSIQKIRVPKDFQGNGYVNVAFVRNWDSPEIFVSPLSFNVSPFRVNHANHAINIELKTPPVARPGEAFPIQYKSDKPGKVIIFAVDEGILQVANYKLPDPLGFFFQKHALEVITQQTVDQILPKFIQARELSAVGGDGGEEALRSHLNPFKRKTDLPVVFWSGIVDIDTTERQLVYQIPDYFNGTLHVMAIAVATDALGNAEKSSVIRGNFVINPNVPTFVAPNDDFEITASIANNVKNSGANAKVSVQVAATAQLELADKATQTLTIPEGQEKTVHYKLRAKNFLGAARIDFTARMENQADVQPSKMNATLSVRPANDYFTTITSGTADASSKTITLDRDVYPEYRHVDAAISNNPLILVVGLQRYLDNFPYGCTEQLISKAFPLVAAAHQPWLITEPGIATGKIAATIQMLGQRQMSNGGFSYWPDMSENDSNAFASVYAMHFLTEARAQGYLVPDEMFRAGINYLKDLSQQDVINLEQARIQAYAIYILTRNEIVTTNYLTNLQLFLDTDKKQVWQKDITSAYLAATYQLLRNTAEADKLITYYKPAVDTDNTSIDFYNNTIANAQYLYLIAKHFPNRLSNVKNELIQALLKTINTNENLNTLSSSFSILGLRACAQSQGGEKFSIAEVLSNGSKKNLTLADSLFAKADIDDTARKVIFSASGKNDYFYQLTQSGFDKKPVTSNVKNGIEVNREYRDLQGKTLSTVSLGNEIEVHIQIRSLSNDSYNNVAIVDLLPGGFEVVNDSVKSENMDYADAREDRVIFFGTVNPDAKEIVYRIKATNAGKYTVPPIFASSMYDPSVNAHSTTGKITIGE